MLIYHVIAHSVANWLRLIFDLLICSWVPLAFKCPLVKAILSVMSRKDKRLKDPLHPPPLSQPPSRAVSWIPYGISRGHFSTTANLDLVRPAVFMLLHCTCGASLAVSCYAPPPHLRSHSCLQISSVV